MATKARTRSRKKTVAKKTTSLTEDLDAILVALNTFRAKHRIVHVQLHSVDTDWIAENDKTPEKGKKCPVTTCPECNVECPHEAGTADEDEECECSCTCDDCNCGCDDCSYCDKCKGEDTPVSTFREYWDESTGKTDTFKNWRPIMVGMNQADADNLWTATGETVGDTVAEIGTDISTELEEQKAHAEALIFDRIEAETAEAKTRKVIERLKLLHSPSEKSAAELACEQDDDEPCASVERFKRLDLD